MALAAFAAAAVLSDCTSFQDWPKFQTEKALAGSKWGAYMRSVYGGLPSSYPFCVSDLWALQSDKLQAAGIDVQLNASLSQANFSYPGTMESLYPGEYRNGDVFQGMLGPTWPVIYHDDYETPGAHEWVEVFHVKLPNETEAMWFFKAPGSGIWMHTGRSITFDDHFKAMAHFNTSDCYIPPYGTPGSDPAAAENKLSVCARRQGYDSVVFRPSPTPVLNTIGMVALGELFTTRKAGKFVCGTEEGGVASGFRKGYNASEPCDCRPGGIFLNCDGSA